MQALLEIKGLETQILTRGHIVRPTRGLDISLPPMGSLGIAGGLAAARRCSCSR